MAGSSDPNVTITFSGDGSGALAAVQTVGAALDSLTPKAKSARVGLVQVAAAMDAISAKSHSVLAVGSAYSQAAAGITSATQHAISGAAALSELAKTASAASGEMTRLGKQANSAGKSSKEAASAAATGFNAAGLVRYAAAMTGITVGAAAVGMQLKSLVTANMELDAAMSQVAAVGNLEKTSAVYRDLLDTVTRLGTTTQFSATQAASGLKELIAAGYSATDAAKALSDTLDLAATDNISMARASEVVVAGLSAFNYGVDQSARFVNVLARAANASPAGVDDLGESLKYAAPVASALGVSLEDAAASLTVLANNGIRGGMAGRGLSSVMARMIAPTKDAADAIIASGVALDELNPKVVGVERALKNLSKLDQAALVKAFGVENLDVSNILAKNASAFPAMQAAMNDTSVTAKTMAERMGDNLSTDLKKAVAAINAVRVAAGVDIYAVLRGGVQSLTAYLSENKDQIAGWLVTAGQLTKDVAKIAAGFFALRAAGKIPSLIADAAKWIAETTAIIANTAALLANKRARAGAEMVALGGGIGGGVKNAVTGWLTDGVGEAFGKGSGGAVAAIGKGFAAASSVVAAAMVGWKIGEFLDEQFDISRRVTNWRYASVDAATEEANKLVELSNQEVRTAKNFVELAKAKESVEARIAALKTKAASADGKEKAEFAAAARSLEILRKHADAFNARSQAEVAYAATVKSAQDAAADSMMRTARATEQAALRYREANEAAALFKAQLPDLGKSITGSLPKSEQLALFQGAEKGVLASAKEARLALDTLLGGSGVTLIDVPKEFSSIDDVIRYYRTAVAAASASGNSALLGGTAVGKDDKGKPVLSTLDPMVKFTEVVKKALELQTNLKTAQQGVTQEEDSAVKKAQAKVTTLREIAALDAKAAGDSTKSDALERENKILAEQVRLKEVLGVSDAEAAKLAARKVAAEEKIAKDAKSPKSDVTIADSLQVLGGGGGFYGAGNSLQEEQTRAAKASADYLKEIRDKVTGTAAGVGGNAALGTTGAGAATDSKVADLLAQSLTVLNQIANNTGLRGKGSGLQVAVV